MKNPIDSRLSSIMRASSAPGMEPPVGRKQKSRMIIRRVERSTGFKFATIRLDNGSVIACAAINHDRFGARLRFSGEASLPERVMISIPEIALRRRARLKWCTGAEAGFEFVSDDGGSR